jgi:hypothetical protein
VRWFHPCIFWLRCFRWSLVFESCGFVGGITLRLQSWSCPTVWVL